MERKRHLFTLAAISVLCFSEILAIQYAPIQIDDFTSCALIIPNNEQYATDLLTEDYNSPVSCITYDAVNRVYAEARSRIDMPVVDDDDWKPEEVAAVGQLLLDVSQQLTKEYDLTVEDIELRLPRIDTMRTDIADICPVYLSAISCRAGKYRRQDGLCNNMEHPTWGSTNTPFTRLLPPQFADYVAAPRISVTGNELPSPRLVSRIVHVDEGYHDHAATLMTVAWGQLMDHDFTLMGTPIDSRNRNEPEECCNRPEEVKNPYCMEIKIPDDDYFYSHYNVKCQDFVRAFPAVRPNCRLGSRIPFNTLTGVIDGNTVYGVSDAQSRRLRAGTGGLLRMYSAFPPELLKKDLLPMKTDIPDEGCTRTDETQYCFLAGEVRVNEQLILTCMHTLMAREHNRVAKELSVMYPLWDDEVLYQESRRIVVAEIQHITFNELLPLILGKEVMQKYDILLSPEGYWDGYNLEINPSILDAFSAAAYRFGHSLLPTSVERWSRLHKFIASKRLSELIRRPYDLYRAGVIDEYYAGLINQVAQAMDDSVTQEVTNNLFKKTGNHFGLDLVSFNIQRGRDFGLPGYMSFRKHCELHTVDTFGEMIEMMPNSTIHRYMSIYEHPWDIDLWSGGVSEYPLPGSLVGPTFACIIAIQMSLLRRGDRFWYELPNQPSSFTPEQLQEIRKIKLSRVLCDNTDTLDTIQIYSMVLPDRDINPRVSCKSSILPKLDLSLWADIPLRQLEEPSIASNTAQGNLSSNANAPVHAYHIKTVAVIGGSSGITNINDIIKPPTIQPTTTYRQDVNNNPHHISKRDVPQSSHSSRDLIRSHFYAPRQRFRPARTQAIVPERNQRIRSENESPGMGKIFLKSMPFYDGVASGRTTHRATRPYSSQNDKEDEEENEQPVSAEEVDGDHESQFEEVPMVIDENGKQKVMPTAYRHQENGHHSQHSFSNYRGHRFQYPRNQAHDAKFRDDFPVKPRFLSSHGSTSYSETFPRAPEIPYTFDHAPFHALSSLKGFSNPLKYRTSHQFNSLSDNQPHYYKHLAPSIRYQQGVSSENNFSLPVNDYEESPASRFRGHDFSSHTDSSHVAYRAPQVPQSLEEYHRLHNSAGGRFRHSLFRGGFSEGRILVPQNDDRDENEKAVEDDKEEKYSVDFSHSKPFVRMNFKNLNLDEGYSVHHHITPSSSRFQSEKPFYKSEVHPRFNSHMSLFSRTNNSESTFPNVGAHKASSNNPQFQDPELIKSFVNSIFYKGNPSQKPASPYNPHFGERVKSMSKPSQNLLWHRKSNGDYSGRFGLKNSGGMFSRQKSLKENEDVAYLMDEFEKGISLRQSKRDIDPEANATDTQYMIYDQTANTTSVVTDDAEHLNPIDTIPTPVPVNADDQNSVRGVDHSYWEESHSELSEEIASS